MKTKCKNCLKESEQEFPAGWYSLLGAGDFSGEFCSCSCLTEYCKKTNVPLDTQWVRWRG